LREFDFNITIDCQGNTKSALAAWLSGAAQRIGYAGRYSGELSPIFNNSKVTPVFSHLTDRSLELLTPLGIHSPRVRWDFPLTKSARTWAARWRRGIGSTRLAVMNPGGTWPSKLWEPERFAATASYIRDRYGYRSVIVWGTDHERALAAKIATLAGQSAVMAPETDLRHLAALIETADLFLSGDTGPLHLAVAVGTPTIGLYGATRPGDSGPYGEVAIQKAYERGSRRHRRQADNRAMRAIGVEHVCHEIDEMEARRQTLRAA
jgi:ADP-heptose:LPS heptosyltransferase